MAAKAEPRRMACRRVIPEFSFWFIEIGERFSCDAANTHRQCCACWPEPTGGAPRAFRAREAETPGAKSESFPGERRGFDPAAVLSFSAQIVFIREYAKGSVFVVLLLCCVVCGSFAV